MARTKFRQFATDASGNTISGAAVEVRDAAGVLATLYEAATGGTTLSNPMTAGTGSPETIGGFEFWIDESDYGDFEITVGSGASAETFPATIGTGAPRTQPTRALLVTAISDGLYDDAPDGFQVTVGGVTWEFSTGATDISDMAGWVPVAPIQIEHFGENTTPGTTDVLSAFNDAVTYLKSLGGGELRLGATVYGVTEQVLIDGSDISIVGVGAGDWRSAPTTTNMRADAATRVLALAGTWGSGDAVIKYQPASGSHGAQGGGIQSVMIDCAARAEHALSIVSHRRGLWRNLTLTWATVSNLELDVITVQDDLASLNYDTQWNIFENVYCENLNVPASNSAFAVRTNGLEDVGGVNGSAAAAANGNPNVSFNKFVNCRFRSNSQHAVRMIGATDNIFEGCSASANNDAAGTTYKGWELTAVEQDARLTAMFAKRNAFNKCGGWIYARAGQSGGNSSKLNRFDGHKTSTFSAFSTPIAYETAAGGSPDPTATVALDIGALGDRMRIGTYTDAQKRRQTLRERIIEHDITTNGGGSSMTISGAIPAGVILKGVTAYVLTILTSTGYQLGDGTTVDRFGSGSYQVGSKSATAVNDVFTSATDLVITATTGNLVTGRIVICLYYDQFTVDWS